MVVCCPSTTFLCVSRVLARIPPSTVGPHIPIPCAERDCFYCRNQQQQQGQSNLSRIPTQSWYPPSVLGSGSLPRASSSPNIAEFASRSNLQSRVLPESPSTVFTATFPPLKDKRLLFSHTCTFPCVIDKGILTFCFGYSVEELRKLMMDKAAYNELLHSLDQVRTLDIVSVR